MTFNKRRLILTLAVGAAIIWMAAAGAGFLYEEVGRRRDREDLPQVGRSIDIGGRTLNISCSGEGRPAVILESAGGPGYVWTAIQKQIAEFSTACWYDRAGEGWSDPGPYPRTGVNIAGDLHELLLRSELPPPYVLVGYSFGGLIVRIYNGAHPNEVAGMVLVDSAYEDEPQRAPKFYLASSAPRYLWHPLHGLAQMSARFGLLRLTQPTSAHSNQSRLTVQQTVQALRRQPKAMATEITTGIVVPESYQQARAAARVGNIPLVVLTAGKPQPWHDAEMDRQAAAYQQIWIREMQAKLVNLSTRGRQIVLEKSDHGILTEAPEAVVAAVKEVVREANSEK
jgi:pimeloyl-ACP methyl ester carboxylesterase